MKKIIVTPAGRKAYLSILSKYLCYFKNLDEFDEWHLWCNTDKREDVNFINELAQKHNFIKVIPLGEFILTLPDGKLSNGVVWLKGQPYYACTIPYFIKNDCTDENSVYLRLDDDIVFIKKGSVKNIFQYRMKNKKNFLVYGNIVNNPVMSYIHQQINALPKTMGKVGFNSRDALGLYNGEFAAFVHNNFFKRYEHNQLKKYFFKTFKLKDYTHMSIQVISWFGKRFAKFGGIIPEGIHEEDYVAEIRPKIEGSPNIVFGDSLFCHYSAEVHRKYVDTTNILKRYEKISNEYLQK